MYCIDNTGIGLHIMLVQRMIEGMWTSLWKLPPDAQGSLPCHQATGAVVAYSEDSLVVSPPNGIGSKVNIYIYIYTYDQQFWCTGLPLLRCHNTIYMKWESFLHKFLFFHHS